MTEQRLTVRNLLVRLLAWLVHTGLLAFVAFLFWYGWWCFLRDFLGFDVVQGWLGVALVVVIIVGYMVRAAKNAPHAPKGAP